MRKPNGFGSIDKLPGKRRRPWRARKTVGFDEKGKQKRRSVGCFRTMREAMRALEEEAKKAENGRGNVTLREIYEMWRQMNFRNYAKNTVALYEMAFRQLKAIHDESFSGLKPTDLQNTFNRMRLAESSKRAVKALLNAIYRFALTYEYVERNLSGAVKLGKPVPIVYRKVFTAGEIKKLWIHKDDRIVATILIMIYSGLRVGEILTLQRKNVYLQRRYMRCGIKTKAGKDRIVPLHRKIIPLLEELMRANPGKNFVFRMPYSSYRARFRDALKMAGTGPHTTHDCRHTFATLLSRAEANETSIRQMIGHKTYETTEKIYVHKNLKDLKKAVDKIKD